MQEFRESTPTVSWSITTPYATTAADVQRVASELLASSLISKDPSPHRKQAMAQAEALIQAIPDLTAALFDHDVADLSDREHYVQVTLSGHANPDGEHTVVGGASPSVAIQVTCTCYQVARAAAPIDATWTSSASMAPADPSVPGPRGPR